MSKLNKLSREQLEKMVNSLADLCLNFVDAQTAERLLTAEGFDNDELEAIGFEVEV